MMSSAIDPRWRAVLLLIGMLACGAAAWNLPYPQPSVYDYSDLYDSGVTGYLQYKPDKFAEEFSAAWGYYRDQYVVAGTGLVSHRQGITEGTNEAVSEGQGYGMLLALLNNDQSKFNSVFAAANQYMWNGGTASYFLWNYPAREQGAATDADLDIGLALVFADKLVEKGHWAAYNSGGVTYRSRALEIIGSIRTRMTSGDYLLPGDSWGGSGISNLNPSYFATAWMKVFNEYQAAHDFTPVIDKCYEVLSSQPFYSVGRARDWCNTTGGNASMMNYGDALSGNDAIRVTWRIAMDALWYNDPRAIQFCKNVKGTLSQYANSDKIELIRQMSLYHSDGSQITVSGSISCAEVAMWACGGLGSGEVAFARGVLHMETLKRIWGTTSPYFGDGTTLDNYYYYKQSLAMLGFAAITGQFPNILADMDRPAEPVSLVTPLGVSQTTVDLPGSVAISAGISVASSWKITVKGRSSGREESFTGSAKNISATWTGSGWYDLEIVDVTLTVSNLQGASAGDLAGTITITSAPDAPVVEPGSAIDLHDCENGSHVTPLGGEWYVFDDKVEGGSSTVNPSSKTDIIQSGVGRNGTRGAKVTFTVNLYAGFGVYIAGEGESVDLNNFESIIFDYRTEGAVTGLQFQLGTLNITNGGYLKKDLDASGSWRTETVSISGLEAPDWSPGSTLDPGVTEKLQWNVGQGTNSGSVYIDNVKLKLKAGRLPGSDLMILLAPSPVHLRIVRQGAANGLELRFETGMIRVGGAGAAPTAIEVYSAKGQCVARIEPGVVLSTRSGYLARFDAGDMGAGIYAARVRFAESGRGPVTRWLRIP